MRLWMRIFPVFIYIQQWCTQVYSFELSTPNIQLYILLILVIFVSWTIQDHSSLRLRSNPVLLNHPKLAEWIYMVTFILKFHQIPVICHLFHFLFVSPQKKWVIRIALNGSTWRFYRRWRRWRRWSLWTHEKAYPIFLRLPMVKWIWSIAIWFAVRQYLNRKKTAKHCQTPADHGLFSMGIVPISRTQSEIQGPSRWTPAEKKSPRIFRLFGTPSAARTTKAGMFHDLNE